MLEHRPSKGPRNRMISLGKKHGYGRCGVHMPRPQNEAELHASPGEGGAPAALHGLGTMAQLAQAAAEATVGLCLRGPRAVQRRVRWQSPAVAASACLALQRDRWRRRRRWAGCIGQALRRQQTPTWQDALQQQRCLVQAVPASALHRQQTPTWHDALQQQRCLVQAVPSSAQAAPSPE